MMALTAAHVAMATRLARIQRGVYRHAALDDLRSDAYLGLVQAAHRYQHGSSASFETFAYRRVLGAMQDGERTRRAAQGWTRVNGVTVEARHFVSIHDREHAVTMRIEDAMTRLQRRRWLRNLPLPDDYRAFVRRATHADSFHEAAGAMNPTRAVATVVRIGRLAAGLAVLLLFAASASAQAIRVSRAWPLTSKVVFTVPSVNEATADPVLSVDAADFGVVTQSCVSGTPFVCRVTPTPAFFGALNALPFPHVVDVRLRNAFGDGPSAGASFGIVDDITSTSAPILGPCPYATAAGVSSPKSLGERFRGSLSWTVGNFASEQAAQDRMTQLQSWGLRYFEVDRGVGFTRGWFQCAGFAP